MFQSAVHKNYIIFFSLKRLARNFGRIEHILGFDRLYGRGNPGVRKDSSIQDWLSAKLELGYLKQLCFLVESHLLYQVTQLENVTLLVNNRVE